MNDKYDFDPQDDLIDQLHLDKGRIYRDLEKQPRFGFLPAMASCSTGQIGALMAESFCAKQAGRWCTVTASSPSTRRGVLDGGDTPHEPRLHWSTSASTRRTLTPGIRQVGLQSSLNRSRSRFEVVDNRANLVGAVHEPVLANPVREPAVQRRFARLRARFTVRGGCRGRSRFTDHASRFTDSRVVTHFLLASKNHTHGLGAGASA